MRVRYRMSDQRRKHLEKLAGDQARRERDMDREARLEALRRTARKRLGVHIIQYDETR